MQFELNDEQKLLADSVRGLLEDLDARQGVVARFDLGAYAGDPAWPGLREMGLPSLLAASERGGLGDELLTLAVVAEALGWAGVGSPAVQQTLAGWVLAQSDADQALVDAVLEGSKLAVFALAEDGGWRPDAWRLAGTSLTGTKTNVIGAADADLLLVGTSGGGLSLVERADAGITLEAASSLDRTRPFATVTFDGAAARPLALPQGTAERLHDALAVVTAADAFGAARRSVEMAVEYAKTREQFGRPIAAFQGLKHQLANMAVEVEPCRALVWYAAHAWDRLPVEAPRAAALAKAHVTDVAVRACRAATEAHGGMGFTWEYPLHVWLKRAIFDRAYLGVPLQHRTRAAALARWETAA